MKHFITLIVGIESVLSFYMYFFPSSFFGPSVVDIIVGLVFAVLAYALFKNPQKSGLQWASILLSLFMGPGGFIGIGGLAALALGVSFIVLSKQTPKP